MGITEQAYTKLDHKTDVATPVSAFKFIESEYVKKPFEIDACASDWNAKCNKYFTIKDNMFSQKLDKTTFMNPPYAKQGWTRDKAGNKIFHQYGCADFIRFAHQNHFDYNSTIAILIFSVVSSSKVFQKYVGDRPERHQANHCYVFEYPERIKFIKRDGTTDGTPAFSSIVIVYDEVFARK